VNMELVEINGDTIWGRPNFLSLSKLHTKLALATSTERVEPAGFGEDACMTFRGNPILASARPVPGVGRANLHNLFIQRNIQIGG